MSLISLLKYQNRKHLLIVTKLSLWPGDYLPRDEYFRHLKHSDFFAYAFKSGIKKWILSRGGDKFHSFKDVKKLYGKIWFSGFISWLANRIPLEFIREILRTDGEPLIKFPIPQVIKNGM